jgi:hypothetical protein
MARTARDTFPLTLRSDGRFCKKLGGVVHYFGRDRAEALAAYHRHVGVSAGLADVAPGGLTIGQLFDAYIARQVDRHARGVIVSRTLTESALTLRKFTKAVGGRDRPVAAIRSSDFMAVLRTWSKGSPYTTAGHVRRVKAAFNWATDSGATDDGPLIDRLPGWGRDFAVPPEKEFELARNQKRVIQFDASEVRELVETAEPRMKAWILLGINAGLITVDLARLTAGDFSGEWLQLPRMKTGQHRRAWLWEETRAAIVAATVDRPQPAKGEDAGLLFLTRDGHPLVRSQPRQKLTGDELRDTIQQIALNRPADEFREHCKAQGLWKRGRGFGQLRHLFLTTAESGLDFAAVSKVMGHKIPGVTGHYRDVVGDDRIKACCEIVHDWLFPPTPRKQKPR